MSTLNELAFKRLKTVNEKLQGKDHFTFVFFGDNRGQNNAPNQLYQIITNRTLVLDSQVKTLVQPFAGPGFSLLANTYVFRSRFVEHSIGQGLPGLPLVSYGNPSIGIFTFSECPY